MNKGIYGDITSGVSIKSRLNSNKRKPCEWKWQEGGGLTRY